jgi:hypothetical protein
MEVKNYVKKPATVEAVQVTGNVEEAREIVDWCKGTMEGQMIKVMVPNGSKFATEGYYIIKDVLGTFDVLKPEVFELIYKPNPVEFKKASK